MEKLFKSLKQIDKHLLLPIIVSVLSALLIGLSYLVVYLFLPPVLPLYYSLPWGQAQLVMRQQFLLLPALIILVSAINSFLAFQLHPSQVVLRRILMLSQIVIDLILTITAIKILFIFI